MNVRAAPAGTAVRTASPGEAPPSSTPRMSTSAGSVPRLTRRSRLTWFRLLPGLNTDTQCRPSTAGAASCIAVTNPSGVRRYASTSTSSSPANSRRQSPSPGPTPPDSPLAALPRSRSAELKCAVSPASSASVTGPCSAPASSNAAMRTSPASAERLNTRAKPCGPDGSAAGNSGTVCTSSNRCGDAVDRFVRCPAGLSSRFITATRRSDSTVSRHLPRPSPRLPSKPSPPASNRFDVKVRTAPGATLAVTPPPGESPSSSTPVIATAAVSAVGLKMCSRLTCAALLPGLKIGTRCRLATAVAVSCIAVRKPSAVRT